MFGKNNENADPSMMQPQPDQTQNKPPRDKQLFYSRITALAVVVMAVTLLISCVIMVPRVVNTFDQINLLIEDASVIMENATTTLEGIDEMSAEIKTAADGINSLVDENSEILTDSVNRLNGIDFEGLNKAIADLEAVVEPMASFFGRFR